MYPNYTDIVVVGHSLGGALATLAGRFFLKDLEN
jgi:putative lipase involved disintegration of autophagic bodies